MTVDAVALAEQTFNITLRQVRADEWRSVTGCPFCGDGGKGARSDRFRVFTDGKPRYWCRQCDRQGFFDDAQPLTEAEKLEARLRAIEARQAEHERRLTVLEQMHSCTAHLHYHRALYHNEAAYEYWRCEGMTERSIDLYQLGYCSRCPTDHDGRASYTIPVQSNGKLWNIRHRLIGGDQGDKYRPHMAGLPNILFNADYLRLEFPYIIITEGEKKSIIAAQIGLPNVGIMGKTGFDTAWVGRFAQFETVYVALDPDATEQAFEIAALFERRGRVVFLPGKLDDLVKLGMTEADVLSFLMVAAPV